MGQIIIETITLISEKIIFIYAIILSTSYLFLALFSFFYTRLYIKRGRFSDDNVILSSPLAPSISLIVPMYNEGETIIDSLRSLLSLRYSNYNVIVVNDGSKDDSLKKVIEYFNLISVDHPVKGNAPTAPIHGIYKSRNKSFGKIIVVDKENGGKADALNAGLNISESKLVATMDADSILAPDALLKMVKPYLQSNEKVIATGAVVRIANSCTIEDGNLVKVHLPSSFLARFQALEYLRVFLLSRIAWSKLNGLLIVSGAFGLFDREIALAAGGYYTETVGEDMELIVRMRRYMHKMKQKYKVCYIPDPLCWTEAPSTLSVLFKQRNRWARGNAETLYKHRGVFLNPKYKLMGILSYPYWLFFEFLAPFVEIIGLIYFSTLLATGKVNWENFVSLLLVVYTFAVFLSILALIAEEFSFYKYAKRSDTFKLAFTAFLEPIVYHPIVLFSSLLGNIDLILGKKSWGEMTRKGFKLTESKEKTKRARA